MRRRFEFDVIAEFQQFLLHDGEHDADEIFPEWTREAGERLLAVEEGIIGVGTISDGIVHVVLEIRDSRPEEDTSGWDQVNEAPIEVRSGRLMVAGVCDDLADAQRIDLEPGSYRVRLHHGNLGSRANDAHVNEHCTVIMWRALPLPLMVLKQASILLNRIKYLM